MRDRGPLACIGRLCGEYTAWTATISATGDTRSAAATCQPASHRWTSCGSCPPWWCWRFNTVGGRGVQLAEKVSGERVGGVRCAFVRRVGVVVATHLLSWAVWRCGRAKALVERFWEITAPCRALSSLCRIDPEDGSRGAAGAVSVTATY